MYYTELDIEEKALHCESSYEIKNAYAQILIARGDWINGIKWFKKAARQGSSEALFNLGIAYHDGIFMKKDWKKAEKYLKKAASFGDKDAEILLKDRANW